ncbi:hypothetical protein MHU86_18043 [Fragilaria crotonensis]|nr:hypothetical protein MHU86_18043 [Fragilaria crotonensis]
MALKLAKTATMAYAAGAGSKYISSATGGASSNLADFVTGDLFALNALATAVACALFKLGDTGFDSLKVPAVMNIVSLVLKMDKSGFNADTIMANKAQTVITLLASVLAFA